MSGDEIRIGFYEDWMFDQVIDMKVAQYGQPREREVAQFRAFYEAPFQRPHGIRLVALDGEVVCGFQSYFYWPYHYAGRRLRSFQSGNSLVSEAYRGRRIFARLLNFLAETEERPDIDFLMGFPVEMSYGSFIRNGWDNPFDLSWFVRPIHPFSVVSAHRPAASDWRFETEPEAVEEVYPPTQFVLSRGADFVDWRTSYAEVAIEYLYFHHRQDGKTVRFTLKANRRGRINELVVGEVARESDDPALLAGALAALVKATRGHSFVTLLSIAINAGSDDPALLKGLRRRGFFKIKKTVPFIVKPLGDLEGVLDPSRWRVFRGDIDTW